MVRRIFRKKKCTLGIVYVRRESGEIYDTLANQLELLNNREYNSAIMEDFNEHIGVIQEGVNKTRQLFSLLPLLKTMS